MDQNGCTDDQGRTHCLLLVEKKGCGQQNRRQKKRGVRRHDDDNVVCVCERGLCIRGMEYRRKLTRKGHIIRQ